MKLQIQEFFAHAKENKMEFFNEACLQMELAIFLRARFPEYKVQLERPITDFGIRSIGGKKEIDICIVDALGNRLAAIELKYPKNGQVPETIYSFCKDLEFCENILGLGFNKALGVLWTSDSKFWNGKAHGIYELFRGGKPIHGEIDGPTGNKSRKAKIIGHYQAEWKDAYADHRYLCIETLR